MPTRADTWEEGGGLAMCGPGEKLGPWTRRDMHTRTYITVSEQHEGRSDVESQPCRTRNVAGEPVEEEDPLSGPGGERSSGQDGWFCGRGTGGVTSSETRVESLLLSVCQFLGQ